MSLARIWELAIKAKKGGLPAVPSDTVASFIEQQRQALGFHTLPILETHVLRILTLALHHGDPFDRMLIAQALTEKFALVINDAKVRLYPVETIW